MIDRRSLLAATAAVAALPGAASARQHAVWRTRADLPWRTQEIYAAELDGQIWTAGGLVARPGGMHINDRTAVYDPASDSWTEGPRLPQPRHHPMLVGAEGRVWAFGGYDRRDGGDWTAMTDVWATDRGVWAQVGQMPSRLCETVGTAVGDRIHLVSGRNPIGEANGEWSDQGDVDSHLVFVASENRWETARPIPMARNSAAGVVMDGKLWVAGGRTVQGGGTGRLDRYDPATDAWDTLAPIPASPSGQQVGGGLALGVSGGRLIAFGGEWFVRGGGGVFSETWIYEPAQDVWRQGSDMITPRHGLAAVSIGDWIYAIGGGRLVSGGEATATLEAFIL